MPLWTGADIARATGGTLSGFFEADGVAFDSREVTLGDLFVAMKGEQADGHDFVGKARGAGASGMLVERPVEGPHVLVEDSFAALQAMARHARERSEARIIGVTGSAGKTGTKEALFRVFDRIAPGAAHRSLKSYNNHVGVPLSMARMPAETRYGIFEMGMNHEGELSALTRLVQPDIALVTTIAPAHIEYFGSEERIADAKAEIFEGLTDRGVAIIPQDSPHEPRLRAAAERHATRVLSFGFGEAADVRALDTMPAPGGGTLVSAQLPSARLSFTIGLPGHHWVANALAVLAVVEALNGDLASAGLSLAALEGLPGRGARRTLHLPDGGEALLIDEAYNANPASMAATLAQLGEERGRRIAVLGAMKELGAQSDALHAGLAGPVRDADVALAILVGAEMAPLADALAGTTLVERAANVQEADAILRDRLKDGDVLLIKGSNSVGLSRLVDALAAETV